ncbi:MAG: methyltransferase domain-containing protein [Pseudonocardiaceae bacterium]|nr:methyltransferase domain-containing protein [Pseudonocardiaceae bacterium]
MGRPQVLRQFSSPDSSSALHEPSAVGTAADAYWTSFYAGEQRAAVPDEPSAFARWSATRSGTTTLLVDIGTGTARDALWFSRQGHEILGLDYAAPAIDQASRTAARERLSATFEVFDLYRVDQVRAMGTRLAQRMHPPLLYGRFLIHALQDHGRHALWDMAATALQAGGSLYLEFRTGKDAGARHEFGEHFRKFLDADTVVDEIEDWGGRIEYRHEDHGLAPYRDEDPHVCRLVSTWKR